jgi:hypothetical protein
MHIIKALRPIPIIQGIIGETMFHLEDMVIFKILILILKLQPKILILEAGNRDLYGLNHSE